METQVSAALQTRSSRRQLLWPALLSLFTLLALLPFARLDFDRHHDGYVLADALAVHEGLVVHKDVFAQYGPVLPWLQSWFLSVPLGPALDLRILNSILIAVAVFLLADIGRVQVRNSPLTYTVGLWAAIAWVLIADVWIGVAMLPWPSTLTALMSVAVLYLLMRALYASEVNRPTLQRILGVSAGLLIGLAIFTKINVGILLLVGVIIGLLVLERKKPLRENLALLVLIGTLASSLAVVFILFLQGALRAYWEQAILWPTQWGGGDASTLGSYVDLLKQLLPQAIPVLLILVATYFWYLQRRSGQWSQARSRGLIAFSILSGIIIVLIEGRNLVMDAPGGDWRSRITSPNFVYLNFTNPNYDYLYLFLALILTLVLLSAAVAIVLRYRNAIDAQALGFWLLLAGTALAGALTVIPRWDPRHVWWAIPIGLLLAAACINLAGTLWKALRNPLQIVLLAVLVMVLVSGYQFLGKPRVESSADWITRGMSMSKDTSDALARDFELVNKYVKSDSQVVYLVPDGDVSILQGRFSSRDPYFVSWGIPKTQQGRLTQADVVLVYGLTDEGIPKDVLKELKDFSFAESQGPIRVFLSKKNPPAATAQ